MGSGDLLITLVEVGGVPSATDTPRWPPRIDQRDVLPAEAAPVPRGHALAKVRFQREGRVFEAEVDFGSHPPEARLSRQANEILASIRVEG